MIALRHLREQVAVIVPDVRLLVGPRSCTCTSPFTSRQSCHVSSPYFKQLILGLWLDFCFTNFLDFNFMFTTSSSTSTPSTAAATTMELYRRARGVLPFVFTFIRTVDQ